MQTSQYKYLKFVRFRDFFQWDLKRYFNQSIRSKFQIFNLGTLISEEKDKFDVSDPKTDYGILGVNNQTGIFDAYIENGSKIKQKYKKMEVGWIAYNPYRVNVGSVGIKRECHKYTYISPAYVVFSCKQSLDPGFLYLALKTPLFNRVIRENTTGSVRQNLSFEVLKNLPIPLPSLSEQQALVATYNAQINAAEEKEQFAEQLNKKIEDYLLDELGVEQKKSYSFDYEPQFDIIAEPAIEYGINASQNLNDSTTFHWGDEIKKEYRWLKFVKFKDVVRWDIWNLSTSQYNNAFKIVCLDKIITMQSGKFLPKNKQHGEKYFVYGGNGITGTHDEYCFEGKRIVVGRVGEYCGNVHLVEGKYWITDNALKIDKISDELSWEYLAIALWNLKLNNYKSISAQPSISQSRILSLSIPVPPFEIQNTIVKHITELKEQIKQLKQEAKELRENALAEFEKEIFEN